MRDLAAKVRWRMRFDHNPVFVTLQDKLAVRERAAECGLVTATILYATDDPRTIPFSDLPADYMIKANHGSGWNIICLNSVHYIFGDGREFADAFGSAAEAASSAIGAPALTEEEVVAKPRSTDEIGSGRVSK